MTRYRPDHKSMEAFLAVARLLSFTKAASILHITVPAVSRRIQGMEIDLGVQLFHRGTRSLSLTPVGRRYFDKLAPALSAVDEANQVLWRELPSNVVTVSVPTLFGANWLLPRLGNFKVHHPDIQVDVTTSPDDGELDWQKMDLAIRSSRRSWSEADVEVLLPITAYPVYSPSLVSDGRPPSSPEELLELPLLCLAGPDDLWPTWFRQMGVAKPATLSEFDDLHLLYEAAAGGLGVAIGQDVLLDAYLHGRRLVQAPRLGMALTESHVLCRPRGQSRRCVGTFRDWLLGAADRWSAVRRAAIAETDVSV